MIDKRIEAYAHDHSSTEDALLSELYRETHLKTVYPRMLSGPLQGKLLEMISRMIRPERILEIGTFTGYATICLGRGLPDNGLIHTIDVDPLMEDIYTKYFEKAGISKKVQAHIGHAKEVIPKIAETFDLVFIDADKENYPDYYKLVMPRLRSGGFILADNVIWSGKVLEPRPDKETSGIIEFNKIVQQDERTENVMLTVRDGLMLIRKK